MPSRSRQARGGGRLRAVRGGARSLYAGRTGLPRSTSEETGWPGRGSVLINGTPTLRQRVADSTSIVHSAHSVAVVQGPRLPHFPARDPASAADPDQESDIGRACAGRRQRYLAGKPRITLWAERDQRCVYQGRI